MAAESTQAGAFWADEELEVVERCLGCNGNELFDLYVGLPDRLGGVPGRWTFVRCAACDSLMLKVRPTRPAIAKAYPEDYVTHAPGVAAAARDGGNGIVWKLANGYLNSRYGARREPALAAGRLLVPLAWPVRQQLDYFFRHLSSAPGRVLDVGCGNGAFLLRAREAGWSAFGIEPDPKAASAAVAAGLDVECVAFEDFAPRQRFDRVTLSHVVEHLHTPSDALTRVFEWLRPGGEIWIAMPNPCGPGHARYGKDWFSLDPPRHLFLPTPQVVAQMLRGAGFEEVEFIRRGRGARSSILPSSRYLKDGSWKSTRQGVQLLSLAIDLLASLSPRFSEEIVLRARRP